MNEECRHERDPFTIFLEGPPPYGRGSLESSHMWQGFRYALRMLVKSPGFTAVAILTLALGIGANTAIFSVVNAYLLRPLPLQQPDRLVMFTGRRPEGQAQAQLPMSVPAYETMLSRTHSLDGIAAFASEGLTLTGQGDPEQLQVALVSSNFLDVLGTHPLAGRGFAPSDAEIGAKPVALISNKLWQSRFGGDADALGKSITLGQEPTNIVGIVPPDFPFPYPDIDVWITGLPRFTGLTPEQIRNGGGFLTVVGRLNAGATLEQANAEIAAIREQYIKEHPGSPDADPRVRVRLVPLKDQLVSDIRPALLLLSGAAGLVLLIACANVASLMLARATARSREIAVRAALGAGLFRIARQWMAESLLLAVAGATLGIAMAWWGVMALVRIGGGNLPGYRTASVDLPVLAFTMAVSLATVAICSLLPALGAKQNDLQNALRDSARGMTGSAHKRWLRSLVVTGQIALSVVLLIGAGLLVESFQKLRDVDLGFNPRNGLTMRISLPPAKYPDDPSRARFVSRVVDELKALPGVQSATASLGLPLNVGVMAPFLADGQPVTPISERPAGVWTSVTPGYFRTLGIPLLEGRDFTDADDGHAPQRVIVSRSLANRFWPGESPIGKHLTYSRRAVVAEIIGVAGDVKTFGLELDSGFVYYTAHRQFAWPNVTLTLRTQGDPLQVLSPARAVIYRLDRDLPANRIRTLEEMVDEVLSGRRQTMYLVAGFAMVAVLLAVVGLYGVMAYSVAQRTAEIGIRQAVGARRADIFQMVLEQGLRLTLTGISIGMVAALAVTRLLAAMLYHVKPRDPLTFVSIALLFLAIAFAASAIPAWRAMRVDPIEALR